MSFSFGPRRGIVLNIADEMKSAPAAISDADLAHFEFLDLVYRSVCAVLYNYVPGSGHPGGSISSGRFVQAILFDALDYDFSNPDAPDADLISYAAGHKALGLYAIWALRNEIVRIARPALLPAADRFQLRLEDLLGFRRNPVNDTPLFRKHRARALDGHPTPATPFLRLATGASGVGVASSIGLALGALDVFRDDPPRVHIVEGEGGMTPGRVAESLACAGTAGLRNAFLHVDWNQASIDSNRVCREDHAPGDYVQWDPVEFAHLHDWNAILVPDGLDFRQVFAAQRRALALDNGQPTAVVYRTVKGWRYGIEGRASHGAGHKLCTAGFYTAVEPLVGRSGHPLPCCAGDTQRCRGADPVVIEECFWEALRSVRAALEKNRPAVAALADRIAAAQDRLRRRGRKPRATAPRLERVYDPKRVDPARPPEDLVLKPGASVTIRQALGDALNYLNKLSGGGILTAAADLLASTSASNAAKGFPEGLLHARSNPDARLIAIGGICEDAMAGVLSGLSAYGWHIGAGSSYGAFIAVLSHIAARLHGIGAQARRALRPDEPYKPFIVICAHAGLKTGEDGPTHADPQPLQTLSENFPRGVLITLTPWEPQDVWPLVAAALARRPAIIAPFVTRPPEPVLDRAQLGLPPPSAAAAGMYALRQADPRRRRDGTIVLQESGVVYDFVQCVLPRIEREGLNLNVFYVSSAELFDLLPEDEQRRIYPEELAQEAMGITGFTLPTMYRWVASAAGRARTLHPFMGGHYLGSGKAEAVLREARLDGESQWEAVRRYAQSRIP
jgi:transketolase